MGVVLHNEHILIKARTDASNMNSIFILHQALCQSVFEPEASAPSRCCLVVLNHCGGVRGWLGERQSSQTREQ